MDMSRDEVWEQVDDMLLARLMELDKAAQEPGVPTQIANDAIYRAERIRRLRRSLQKIVYADG